MAEPARPTRYRAGDDSTPAARRRTDPAPHFYPLPGQRKRTVMRWLVFLLHTLTLAGAVFLLPDLPTTPNEMGNWLRLLLPAWAVLLAAHLLLVGLLDLREGVIFARRARRRRRMMQAPSYPAPDDSRP